MILAYHITHRPPNQVFALGARLECLQVNRQRARANDLPGPQHSSAKLGNKQASKKVRTPGFCLSGLDNSKVRAWLLKPELGIVAHGRVGNAQTCQGADEVSWARFGF